MCVLIAVLAGAQMLFGMPTGSSYDAAGPDGTEPTYVWEHGQDGRRLSWRHQFGKDTVLYAQGSGMPVEHRLSDGLVRKITYDHRGNRKRVLTFVENDTAASHWIREEKMEFDLRDGLRGYTKITRHADGTADTVVRHYVLDERGWRIAELDGDSTVLKKWVYRGNYVAADSGNSDGPYNASGWKYYNGLGEQSQAVAFMNGLGKLDGRWYLTDHLGSVAAVEDGAGERTLSLSLDPWGNLEVAKGSEGVGYGYTGKQLDALLGCSDHGARCLDNRMGMWWGRDRAKQWWNVYIYAAWPLVSLDMDGMVVDNVDQDEFVNFQDEVYTNYTDRKDEIMGYYQQLVDSKNAYEWSDVYEGWQNLRNAWDKMDIDYSELDCSGLVRDVLTGANKYPPSYNSTNFHKYESLEEVEMDQSIWGDVLQWNGHVAIHDPISKSSADPNSKEGHLLNNVGARRSGYKSGVYPNSWWGKPVRILREK